MYGEWVTIGALQVWVPGMPHYTHDQWVNRAMVILRAWVDSGCPENESVRWNDV